MQDEHDVLHELIGSSDDDAISSEAEGEGAESESCTHDSCSDSSVILGVAQSSSSSSMPSAPIISVPSVAMTDTVKALRQHLPASVPVVQGLPVSEAQMAWFRDFQSKPQSAWDETDCAQAGANLSKTG